MREFIVGELQFELQAKIDVIGNEKEIPHYMSIQDMTAMWDYAIHLTRIQNDYLRDGMQNEATQRFLLYSAIDGSCIYRAVRAHKRYTRKQWFILLWCSENYLTLEDCREYVERLK